MRRVAKLWRTEMTGAVSTFTYDAKDRLTQDATSAPLAHTYTYTYDSRDNILTNSESGSVVQMNYDAASRLTTSTAGGATTTYTFDSNGNLTGVNEAGTLTTMVYDKENRLKEHKQGAPGSETAFTYDLNSLKQSTTSGLVTDQLVWDGADMLGEVPAVKPVGAPLMPTRYNLAQGILFATTRFEPAATRTDAGADFIGSILIDFDENGDYIAERRYKPYGELLAGTATTYGWTGNTGSRAMLLQYAEQYNRRRHYSTKLKQWTTRDPLWPDESAYGYVRGGPLTWADPNGTTRTLSNGKKYCAIYYCEQWDKDLNRYVHAFACVTISPSSRPNQPDGKRRICASGFFKDSNTGGPRYLNQSAECAGTTAGVRCTLVNNPYSKAACLIAEEICNCMDGDPPQYDIIRRNCRQEAKKLIRDCGCLRVKLRFPGLELGAPCHRDLLDDWTRVTY